jgi:hypothetical protein
VLDAKLACTPHSVRLLRAVGRRGPSEADRRSASGVHQSPRVREKVTPAMNERIALYREHHVTRALVAAMVSMIAVAANGCGNENEACSWLFAPASFVDAGQPGCTAAPAGETCDRSSGRCQNICKPLEYLLTCRPAVVSGPAIPQAELEDPVVVSGGEPRCRQVPASGEKTPSETTYCCQCGR